MGQLVGFTVTLGGFKVDCLKFFLKAKIISYAQRVEKISLCETDSPDTGEVALAPEGERCLEGAEGENLVIARNISGYDKVLSLRPFETPLPLWRKRHLSRIGGVCLAEGDFFDTLSVRYNLCF